MILDLGPSNPKGLDTMPWARHEMHSLPVGLVGALVKDITVTFAFAVRTWKMGGLQICLIQYALYTFG